MPYTPTVWVSGTTAVDAIPMNNLETQHAQAVADILTVAETEVFSGNSPIGWTDLDLSAVVGANPALVLLKIHNTNAASNMYAVRKNGDADEFYPASGGVAESDIMQDRYGAFVVATDNAGKIEWRAEAANANCTVDVIAYVITS